MIINLKWLLQVKCDFGEFFVFGRDEIVGGGEVFFFLFLFFSAFLPLAFGWMRSRPEPLILNNWIRSTIPTIPMYTS